MIFQQNQLFVFNQVLKYGVGCRAVFNVTKIPNWDKYKHCLFQFAGKSKKILHNRGGMDCCGVCCGTGYLTMLRFALGLC